MIPDAYLDALREYEREIAPAHEVVRLARHRLAERLRALLDHPPADDLRLHAQWAAKADPEEPNGPELAMPIEQPVQGPAMERQGTGESGTSPAAPTDAEAVRDGRTPADQAGERGFDTRPPLQTQPGPAAVAAKVQPAARPSAGRVQPVSWAAGPGERRGGCSGSHGSCIRFPGNAQGEPPVPALRSPVRLGARGEGPRRAAPIPTRRLRCRSAAIGASQLTRHCIPAPGGGLDEAA